MTDTPIDIVIRQAIGGDPGAIAWISDNAGSSQAAIVLTMAAVLGTDPDLLRRALLVATTPRDRQVVAIASALLAGDGELVDALARDHLVDHPDSYVVSWIASGAAPAGRYVDPH